MIMVRLNPAIIFLAIFLVGITLNSCASFTTLQTARVNHGFHLTTATGILTDQTRKGNSQGSDIVAYAAPTIGFGQSVGFEFGVPLVYYLENGLNKRKDPRIFPAYFDHEDGAHFLILPYFKLASNQNKSDVVAGIIDPSSVTLIYSHDFNKWTPYLSLRKMLLFGNPAIGDIPRVISRYQEDNQSVLAFAFGAEWNAKFQPAIEIGMLRNSYIELTRALSPRPERVLYDFFLGLKFTF